MLQLLQIFTHDLSLGKPSYHNNIGFFQQTIGSRVFHCITCFLNKPDNAMAFIDALSSSQVTPSCPFHWPGMAVCCALTIESICLLTQYHNKVYPCIFISVTTKAVNVEVVTNLRADAFILSLDCFTSRRGPPSYIRSTCGTNVVGTDTILQQTVKAFPFNKPNQPHLLYNTISEGIQFSLPLLPTRNRYSLIWRILRERSKES